MYPIYSSSYLSYSMTFLWQCSAFITVCPSACLGGIFTHYLLLITSNSSWIFTICKVQTFNELPKKISSWKYIFIPTSSSAAARLGSRQRHTHLLLTTSLSSLNSPTQDWIKTKQAEFWKDSDDDYVAPRCLFNKIESCCSCSHCVHKKTFSCPGFTRVAPCSFSPPPPSPST